MKVSKKRATKENAKGLEHCSGLEVVSTEDGRNERYLYDAGTNGLRTRYYTVSLEP